MSKWTVGFLCCGLAVAAVAEDVDVSGPRVNPEDQRRGIWHCTRAPLPTLSAMGFNTLLNPVWSGVDMRKVSVDAAAVAAERRRVLEVTRALGWDYVEAMNRVYQRLDGDSFYSRHRLKDPDGKPRNGLDMSDPEAFATVTGVVAKIVASIGSEDLDLAGVMPSSEVRDNSHPSLTPAYKAAWAAFSGGKPLPPSADRRVGRGYPYMPQVTASRIIDDDDPDLTYWTWFWKRGDGWNGYQGAVADLYGERFGRKVFSMYDPAVRVPPIWGSGGRVSHLNHWTYVYPEPFNISFIAAETAAMARGCPGQRTCQMIQAISYRSGLAPKGRKPERGPEPAWVKAAPDAPYISTPPDMVREAMWTLFSHQIDGIFFHGWQSVLDPKVYRAEQHGYHYTNAETKEVISNVFNAVGVPLGPLFKALPEAHTDVAFVESAASVLFAWRGGWGWSGRPGCDLGALGTLGNLAPRVLYEEELKRDGVPKGIKVLLMPCCDVLTRGAYQAVRRFQEAGGYVIGDEHLVPGVLPDGMFPAFRKVDRAAEDTPMFRRAARDLKAEVTRFVTLAADTDRDDVFVRLRRLPGADYAFVINDRRGPGDYVGPWGLVWEKGLPNRTEVTVRREKTAAVYDLVRHAEVPFAHAQGVTRVSLAFDINDGRALMFVPEKLTPLDVRWTAQGLSVVAHEHEAMIPIRLDFDDGKTFYGCVKEGAWRPAFAVPPAARTVTVTNLADGRKTVCGR